MDMSLFFRSESERVALGMAGHGGSFGLSIVYTVETASVLLD